MAAPGKVFISHTHEDGGRFAALVALLRAWGVDLWYDEREPHAGEQLSERTQMAMAESGILLRLCTVATRRSYWMSLETGAFLSLQAEDYRQGRADQRRIVNLIADAGYVPEPFDRATTVIDAVSDRAPTWLAGLRAALSLAPLPPGETPEVTIAPRREPVSRRRVLALGAGGAALVVAGTAGALYVRAGGKLPLLGGGHKPTPKATPVAAGKPPAITDKHLKWYYQTGDKIVASPVVAGDLVLIGSEDGKLYALDAATGKQRWNDDFGASVSSPPTVVGNVVYQRVVGDLVALDLAAGKLIWHIGYVAVTQPVVVGDYVYVGNVGFGGPGVAQAFTTASGKYVWSAPGSQTPYEIAVVGTTVYLGCSDGTFFTLDGSNISAPLDPAGDANKGTTRWTFKAGDEIHGLRVVDGVIYFGCFDHHVYALDAASGALRWKAGTGNQNWSTPAVANGMVYFGSADGNVYAVDQRSGQQVWSYKTGGPIWHSSPTLANGLLYIASQDQSVYGLNPTTGTLAQQFKTANQVISTPAYANGLVYVGCTDGYCYAFSAAR
jgi:outer membrane protein assembly factor BamB